MITKIKLFLSYTSGINMLTKLVFLSYFTANKLKSRNKKKSRFLCGQFANHIMTISLYYVNCVLFGKCWTVSLKSGSFIFLLWQSRHTFVHRRKNSTTTKTEPGVLFLLHQFGYNSDVRFARFCCLYSLLNLLTSNILK